jgi:cobyrinic acid a,c-diamide synthase
MPANESDQAEARINAIADKVRAQVDIDALIQVAAQARYPAVPSSSMPLVFDAPGVKLAYASDPSFGFYYQEDLDTLRGAGVEMIPLNTLVDQVLPPIDGLIIGGGFPELFIKQLTDNHALRSDILRAVEAGLPVYAECGGLMYLSRSLRWKDQCGAMVGVIPGDTEMAERPVGRGYAALAETDDGLWPAQTETIPAHEFHYSHLKNLEPGLTYAYRILRGQGIDGARDGFVYRNLLASYCHRRGSGRRGWIAPFLAKVKEN